MGKTGNENSKRESAHAETAPACRKEPAARHSCSGPAGINHGGILHVRFRSKIKIAVEGKTRPHAAGEPKRTAAYPPAELPIIVTRQPLVSLFQPFQHLLRGIQTGINAAQVPLLEDVADENVPAAARNPGSEPFKRIPPGHPFMKPGAVIGKIQIIAAEINGAPRAIPSGECSMR